MTVSRLAAAPELLEYLGDGFGLLAPSDGEDASAPLEHMREKVEGQLTALSGGDRQQGEARVQLVGRTFVSGDQASVLAALGALNDLFELRRQSSCIVDVVLLMQDLFDKASLPSDAAKRTKEFVRSLDGTLPGLKNISRQRVWLIDGLAQDGACYTIDTMGDILRAFEPDRLDSSIGTLTGNYFGIGARVVVFPRTRILDYLGTRFALRVLERERGWLDGTTRPFAVVAGECSNFIEGDVERLVAGMERDDQGQQLVPAVTQPPVVPEEPLAANMARVHDAVEDLSRQHLDRIQDQLARNHRRIAGQLAEAVLTRVNGYLDTDESRVVSAEAFLDMLQGSMSPILVGDQIETGRHRTLRQAFADAIAFFDQETGFDTQTRPQLERLREDLYGQRHWLQTIEEELASAIKHRDAGRDGAAGDADTLEAKKADAEEQIAKLAEQLDEASAAVKSQDMDIQSQVRRRDLYAAMMARVQTGIDEAAKRIGPAKAAMDAALEAFRSAEAALRDALVSKIIRVVGTLLVLVLLGIVAALALPAVFGAVPLIGAPLFGFIGTVLGAKVLTYWAVGTVLGVLGMAIFELMRYLSLRKKIRELEGAYETSKAVFVQAMRGYWGAYVQKFQKQCDWIRFSHVFDTERETLEVIEEMRRQLEGFRTAMVGYRSQAAVTVASFKLDASPTELIAVDAKYVETLVDKKSAAVDGLSGKFFAGHVFSAFFEPFRSSDATLEMLDRELKEACSRDVFFDVAAMTVKKAIQESNFDMAIAAHTASCFLPISPQVRPEQFIVVVGADGQFLRDRTSSLVPSAIVIETDDEERVLVLKIAHDIKLDQISVLA